MVLRRKLLDLTVSYQLTWYPLQVKIKIHIEKKVFLM